MSRILKVSQSDYRIIVGASDGVPTQQTPTITLDTGAQVGQVVITGNLVVQGNSTTVESETMVVKDNKIVINDGEQLAGVTLDNGTAGIIIDRGSLPNSQILFDEQVYHWDAAAQDYVAGSFVLNTDDVDNTLSGLRVGSIANDGTVDLVFDLSLSPTESSETILRLRNGPDDATSAQLYSDTLIDAGGAFPSTYFDNAIPNKKFVGDYVNSGILEPGMADVDKIYKSDGFGGVLSKVQAYNTTVQINIGSNIKAQASSVGFDMGSVRINEHTITDYSLGTNLILTSTTKNIDVNATFELKDQNDSVPSAVVAVTNATKLFSSATKGAGKSNIYFVTKREAEDGSGTEIVNDELIAKNRALLFSMLF